MRQLLVEIWLFSQCVRIGSSLGFGEIPVTFGPLVLTPILHPTVYGAFSNSHNLLLELLFADTLLRVLR